MREHYALLSVHGFVLGVALFAAVFPVYTVRSSEVQIHIYQARRLVSADDNGSSDPYCKVCTRILRARVVWVEAAFAYPPIWPTNLIPVLCARCPTSARSGTQPLWTVP